MRYVVINKQIITFFIFLFACTIAIGNIPDNPKGFDSTACAGYVFFKNKGIVFDSTSNIKLYNEVYSWLGVPYKWGGKTKSGADCSGFASAIYKAVYGIQVGGSAGDIYKTLKSVEKADLREGDLVFFKINRYAISHVGVYLNNNKFIHATSYGKTVTVSDLNEVYYKRYYYSAGRYEQESPESSKQ